MQTYGNWKAQEDVMVLYRLTRPNFPLQSVDCTLIGHTSNPEYERLGSHKDMDALRDRTVKIDVPFLQELKDFYFTDFMDKHKARYANLRSVV